MERCETLDIDRWGGPIEASASARAVAALEGGRVLVLPRLAFDLGAAEQAMLASAVVGGGRKNISFDPATGACRGRLSPGAAAALAAVLRRFGDQAQALVAALAPGYAAGLERARSSFRPDEVEGRRLPWRKDDTRRHVDAFPSRPTRGRRILRVFCNVDPAGAPRRWRLGEPFEAHAARFLPRLRRAPPGQAAILERLGVTRGRRSRYDDLMLGLHDAAKRDMDYQASGWTEDLAFPAGCSWVVFSDQVVHSVQSGRWALEQTFHLDPAAMAEPERAPLSVLNRLTGKALA